jgi:transcriptional regulator with XRE-family HTH domain
MSAAGELVRARREAHGLSQARLARRAGTGQAAISRIERGLTSPTTAMLAKLLGAMGEELELASARPELAVDPAHLEAQQARTPAERLELGLAWNRLAGEIAAAGAAARRAADDAAA